MGNANIPVLCDTRTSPRASQTGEYLVLVRERGTFYPPPSAVHIRGHHTLSRFIDVG
ncbi:hypothetical protein J3E68DRAFT_400293 [Trichoderma sp. SZMC 28012]